MDTEIFRIEGGTKLSGEIEVRGSKNAAAPIIAATLLTKEPCIIRNVPRIEDVFRLLEILESMGSKIDWIGDRTVRIENADIHPDRMNVELVKKIRFSILLLGSLSARFDSFSLAHPGGCAIGSRPVDAHFDALRKLGVESHSKEKFYVVSAADRHPASVVMKEFFSVTATEIALMLAASLPGTTTLKISAAEPHVEDLGRFLISMGANIEGLGTHTISVEGGALCGTEHTIIPDPIEAATFLVLGAATKSDITVCHARRDHLDIVLEKLREFGVGFEYSDDTVRIIPTNALRSPGKVKTEIYPGIPTDTQSLFGVLSSLADGETLIHDHIYESRFNYLAELEKMRVMSVILNPHQAVIHGPAHLRGTTIKSFDLRAGAALIIAALAAEGTTTIEDIYQVDRGYERIEERLQKIGAKIERVNKE
ncbi:MAG: UDP-N-acetylglucosamine 1-carboxyvinyltransferase [Candidatus Moraniibacteriota bacterium]|nr:MAG: UDP-N-acetylglucosamine 1-carboxyvinyltransferase [Candidatus Moranbacteria bacterium]